jgi:hypothetical protein
MKMFSVLLAAGVLFSATSFAARAPLFSCRLSSINEVVNKKAPMVTVDTDGNKKSADHNDIEVAIEGSKTLKAGFTLTYDPVRKGYILYTRVIDPSSQAPSLFETADWPEGSSKLIAKNIYMTLPGASDGLPYTILDVQLYCQLK